MERARTTWTDERLDDLSHRVDSGFARLDGDMAQIRSEISQMRVELGGRIDSQGAELGARIESLQRTLIQIGGAGALGFLATLVSVFATRGG